MAKIASFQAKVAKSSVARSGKICPKCGQAVTPVKFIVSELSPLKNSWKFNQRFVDVCKCNENDVYNT